MLQYILNFAFYWISSTIAGSDGVAEIAAAVMATNPLPWQKRESK